MFFYLSPKVAWWASLLPRSESSSPHPKNRQTKISFNYESRINYFTLLIFMLLNKYHVFCFITNLYVHNFLGRFYQYHPYFPGSGLDIVLRALFFLPSNRFQRLLLCHGSHFNRTTLNCDATTVCLFPHEHPVQKKCGHSAQTLPPREVSKLPA